MGHHTKGVPMEGPNLKFSEAVLDNGKFGKHVVRFEAGLLAQQADQAADRARRAGHAAEGARGSVPPSTAITTERYSARRGLWHPPAPCTS